MALYSLLKQSPERRALVRSSWRDAAPTSPPTMLLQTHPESLRAIELDDTPRDCVQCYPAAGMGYTLMVGHDGDGIVQVELRLPSAWVTPGLERFLLRMLRHYGTWRLRRLK